MKKAAHCPYDRATTSTTPTPPVTPPPPPEDSFYLAAYEVTKASVTRARAGAEWVEKAATGILALYSGALTVSFSVTDNPLPLRGVIPAVFLAMALVFAAFYLGFPSQWTSISPPQESTKQAWFAEFGRWMEELVNRRTNYLRASLVALAFGAVFLPAAFVHVKTTPADPPTKAE